MEATRAASRVSEIRIGLGGAAPIPVRARQAEAVIKGRELTDAVIRDPWGAEVAATAAEPLSDLMGSADYRRQMIRVWERRLSPPSGAAVGSPDCFASCRAPRLPM